VSSFRTGQLPIIAALVLLSPVFAFLIAIAAEILIGSLVEAGVPALLAVAVAGAIGWALFYKLRSALHPPGPASLPRSIRHKVLNIIARSKQARSKS
jgi:hypothetical protein